MLERAGRITGRITRNMVIRPLRYEMTHTNKKVKIAAAGVAGAGIYEVVTGNISQAAKDVVEKADTAQFNIRSAPVISLVPGIGADDGKTRPEATISAGNGNIDIQSTPVPTATATETPKSKDNNLSADGKLAVRAYLDGDANGLRGSNETTIAWKSKLLLPDGKVISVGDSSDLSALTVQDGSYAACPEAVSGWVFTNTTNGCLVGVLENGKTLTLNVGLIKKTDMDMLRAQAASTPDAALTQVVGKADDMNAPLTGQGNVSASEASGVIALAGLGLATGVAVVILKNRILAKRHNRA